MAKKVLDEIITDGMSDYEKELAVYNWMVKNIKNDSGMMSVIPTKIFDTAMRTPITPAFNPIVSVR